MHYFASKNANASLSGNCQLCTVFMVVTSMWIISPTEICDGKESLKIVVAKDILTYGAENDEERHEESPTISGMSHDYEIVIKYRKDLVDVARMQ